MLRSRAAAAILSSLAVLLAVAAWPATRAVLTAAAPRARAAVPAAGALRVVTGGTFGFETDYTTGSGDTWFNTWGANGDIYATSNDTTGFNGTCNNDLVVNELAGDDPTQLTEPYVNCMTSYGGQSDSKQDPDGCTWKTGGITSVSGILYLVVARQGGGQCKDNADGEQMSLNASIVKSTDGGRTWSNGFGTTDDPTGAAPQWDASLGRVQAMWPGQTFAAPFFIQYGQDDNPTSTADGGGTYVYAVSNDGYAYDGNYLILGRVLRSQIGNLDATDWQYYDGPPGGDGMDPADWTSDVSDATHVLTAEHQVSQPDIQYYPALHEYIMSSSNFPFNTAWPDDNSANSSSLDLFEAPHPWGPWTKFLSKPMDLTVCYFTCSAYNSMPLGMYDVAQVSKFADVDGLSDVLFIAGDFIDGARSRYDEPDLYSLHELPMTLSSPLYHVTDDSSPAVAYTGTWASSQSIYNGLSPQNDYYDETYHESATAGASVSFTFTGTSIQWIGSYGADHGIASVSVDGAAPVSVDTYSADTLRQQVLFSQNGLSPGRHTIAITITSSENPSSSGTEQDVDAFVTSGP
jgi:hypothetical protein